MKIKKKQKKIGVDLRKGLQFITFKFFTILAIILIWMQ